jgi:hypothetical protein
MGMALTATSFIFFACPKKRKNEVQEYPKNKSAMSKTKQKKGHFFTMCFLK